MYDEFDDFEITPEEEEEMLTKHINSCTKEQNDIYCKVCKEY